MTLYKDPEGSEKKHLHRFVDFTGARVLEVGCGEGRLTWKYAPAARTTIGIDPDRPALRVASIERPSDLQSRVLFACAESQCLPFPGQSFDIAVLAWSL